MPNVFTSSLRAILASDVAIQPGMLKEKDSMRRATESSRKAKQVAKVAGKESAKKQKVDAKATEKLTHLAKESVKLLKPVMIYGKDTIAIAEAIGVEEDYVTVARKCLKGCEESFDKFKVVVGDPASHVAPEGYTSLKDVKALINSNNKQYAFLKQMADAAPSGSLAMA